MIRAFAAEDAAAVAVMVAALNAEEGYDRATAADAAALPDAFLGPHACGQLLVAEDQGALNGYVTLHPSFETEFGARGCYLGDVYVVPAARRGGVGRRLIGAAAAACHTDGGRFLWWTALPGNAAGHAFYAALGAVGQPVRAFALTGAAFAKAAAPAP